MKFIYYRENKESTKNLKWYFILIDKELKTGYSKEMIFIYVIKKKILSVVGVNSLYNLIISPFIK